MFSPQWAVDEISGGLLGNMGGTGAIIQLALLPPHRSLPALFISFSLSLSASLFPPLSFCYQIQFVLIRSRKGLLLQESLG